MRGSYTLVERIFDIINRDSFYKKDIMDKYEISKNTFYRDLEFIRNRLNVNIVYNRYYEKYEKCENQY